MSHNHDPEFMLKIEEQLGADAEDDLIAEVAKHMEECPDCKIYIDSIKQTISLYRTTEKEQSIPDDVSDRLFRKLDLKDFM